MAVTTVSVTGKVLTPTGGAAVGGAIIIRLSQPGTALDGASSQRIGGGEVVKLSADGSVSFNLVPNESLSPTGTYYTADFSVVRSDSRSERWIEKWQVPASPSATSIGDIPRLDVIPGVALGSVMYGGTPYAQVTTAQKPAAAAEYAGVMLRVKDVGADEQLEMCRQLADGSYEWIVVAF